MDSIQKKMDSIQVAIKVRPLIKREVDEGLQSQWEIQGNSITAKDPELRKRSDHRFVFDHIFDEGSTNERVFQVIVKPIIDAAVNGFNGTVFAYGQTSSGKTYTMMGSDNDPGITQLAVQHMFAAINQSKDREFLLRVSSLEIYNEKVKDLLANGDLEVKIHEGQGGIVNVNCKEEVINSAQNIFYIMKKSDKNRKIGETNMNERSSRGHTIFRITIESRALDSDSDGAVQVSQINLVDLAGSERQRQAGTTGERFKEGMHINLSLTMLGRVIKQLSEGQDFVSFRDSKLTRLLQNSLGGNALTAVICAVTPASVDETACSLSFASRAKSITTKPQLNEVMTDAALLKRYAKQIAKLNTELEKLKKDNRFVDVQEMESKLQEKDKANQILEERIALMKCKLVTGYGTQKEEPTSMASRRRTWGGCGTLKPKLTKFPNSAALETITEMSPEKPHRKSIIQTVDFTDQSFEGFADFEVDLIESERDRLTTRYSEDGMEDRISTRSHNTVKQIEFSDNINVLENSCRSYENTPVSGYAKCGIEADNLLISGDLEITPKKKNMSVQTAGNLSSPDTPKHILRNTLSTVTRDYEELRTYTTLEKQVLCDDSCVHVQKLEELESHIVDINSEKAELERNILELNTEIQKQKQESDCKQKNITEDNEDLLRRIKALTDSKMTLGEINAKLTLDLQKKIEEFEEVKKKSECNADLLKQIKDLTDANSKLTADLSEKNRECEAIKKETSLNDEELLKRVNDLTIAKEALEIANTKLLEDRQNSECKLKEIQDTSLESEDLLKKIKDLTDDKTSLEEMMTKLKEDLQSKESELEKVQNEAAENNEGLLKQIQELSDAKTSLEETNSKLIHDVEETARTLEEVRQEAKRNSDDYSMQINDLTQVKTSLEEAIAKLTTDLQKKEEVSETPENAMPQNVDELLKKINELSDAKVCLEEQNSKLSVLLNARIQKSEEIQRDICSIRTDVKKFEETINLLTSENSKLFVKLELQINKAEKAQEEYQETISTLYKQISTITNEKKVLEEDMTVLQEKLQTIQSRALELTDENIEQTVSQYQKQIDSLRQENVELTEKINELSELHESKSLEFEHDCHYKEKVIRMEQDITQFKGEIFELSNDLMEKVSEYDDLQKEYTTLKEKYNMTTDVSTDFAVSDAQHLHEENNRLKLQLVELNAKLSTLSAENENFAKYYTELMEQCDSMENANHLDTSKLNLSILFNTSTIDTDDTATSVNNSVKITDLQCQNNHLKNLNKRLAELKLGPCTKCKYLKELNENCRANKLQVSKLQRKLDLYKRQLKYESAEAEMLMNKTHEDLNLSGYDSPFNTTLQDGINVTCAEEKLQSIRNELEAIKDNENLSKLLIENNIENIPIQLNDSTSAEMQKINEKTQAEKPQSKLKSRIGKIENDLNQLNDKVGDMKKSIDKYVLIDKEISTLKSINAALEEKLAKSEIAAATANDSKKILEEEVSNLMGRIEELVQKEKAVEKNKLLLTVEIEDLKSDRETKDKRIEDLHKTINELNEHLSTLTTEVDSLKKLNEELYKSKEFIEHAHVEQLNIVKRSYEESCKEFEEKLNKKDEALTESMKENQKLQQEVGTLEKTIQDRIDEVRSEYKKSSYDVDKLKDELDNIKKTIIKEIKCLKPKDDLESLPNKSTDELFRSFSEAIILKQSEIAEVLQEKFNRATQKLEDEKQQSVDAEKRMTLYVKSLESDSEKLQNDLTEQEKLCKSYEEKVSQLQHTLKETNKEKSMIMNKLETLEAEYNNLQVLFEKQSKVEVKQEDVHFAQKTEKLIHEALTDKEAELQSRFNLEKEAYENKIIELTSAIDALKTKNMELKNNIEGLEANEKQLKSVIDIKLKEITKNNQNIIELNAELSLLRNDFNDLSREVEEKKSRLAEISAIMKTKCDTLSEYKTKLDEIMPEYDTLMSQSQERKMYIERCKTELENLKTEKQKEIDALNDQLNSETVKCTALNKQIIELKNKNTVLLSDLNELKVKYEELQIENTRLERKIRHSTSKIKAETEIQELKDLTKSLQNHLDGASNRITELQENKSRLLTELMDLRGQYDFTCQENEELKKTVSSYKSKLDDSDLLDLRVKYDNLLQNKNKLALELEEKKILLVQKGKDIENLTNEVKSLTDKNKELDDECDELANDIRKKNTEYAELEEKYFSLLVENQKDHSVDVITAGSVSVKEIDDLRQQNEQLKGEIELLQRIKEAHSECIKKLNSVDTRADVKLKNGSTSCRNVSPSSETNNRRRRSRNNIFYQRRQLDNNSDVEENTEDRCEILRKKIHELELELVSKNGKIATLEMQIQSENFPYQRKCKDLEEKLLVVVNKNAELKSEVKKVQRAMRDIGSRECDTCRRWQTNRRDQTTQTLPDNVIRFCGTSSGIVDEHIKIQKLEKAHALMKNLCRTRNRRIKELEDKIKELEEKENCATNENTLEAPQGYTEKLADFDKNFRLALNENIQPNILGKVLSSNYTRRAWHDY